MASDSRALTLKLLADTADFQKKLEAGSKDLDSIGERAAEFGKKAAVAFAAAGAAVGAFAVSAVKAAAEDETAQRQLAATIEATTNATAQQIAGVEEYIKQTSIAIGVTDDQLRPAFARLVRSTKDVEEAQNLLNLALDIASATGRPLEAVSNALGRAYDGNTTALGRLGLGLDANILKSKDFDSIFQTLTSTFGNFAENEALSTEKQMERVRIALDEAKESIGAALLPVVQDLTKYLLENFIPALEAFIGGLTGQDGLDGALTESQQSAYEWGQKVRGIIDTVIELKEEILIAAGVMAAAFTVSKIAAGITAIISLIKGLIVAYNALKSSAIVAGVAQAFALNPALGLGAVALAAAVLAGANALAGKYDTSIQDIDGDGGVELGNRPLGGRVATSLTQGNTQGIAGLSVPGISTTGSRSTGSSSSSSQPTLLEIVANENFIKNLAPGNFNPSGVRRADEVGNVIINVNSPSVIDEEGFTRAVVMALNNSQNRNGGGGSQLLL
jgi:tellurite resistance protein